MALERPRYYIDFRKNCKSYQTFRRNLMLFCCRNRFFPSVTVTDLRAVRVSPLAVWVSFDISDLKAVRAPPLAVWYHFDISDLRAVRASPLAVWYNCQRTRSRFGIIVWVSFRYYHLSRGWQFCFACRNLDREFRTLARCRMAFKFTAVFFHHNLIADR